MGHKVERNALSTIEFKSAKADMGYKVERNALSTIEFKSAKADMGYKVERNFQPYVFGPIPTWEKARRERHGNKDD